MLWSGFCFASAKSEFREMFVLKGALLFELWTEEAHRPTRDADFLTHGDNDLNRFESIFSSICSPAVAADGSSANG